MSKLVINGKFLSAGPTGVHRVAAELANALAAMKAEGAPEMAGIEPEIWAPSNGAARAPEFALPTRIRRPLTYIPWEQITLPLLPRDGLLLNLCNIGPVLSRDAVTMIHDAQVYLTPGSYSFGFRRWYYAVQPLLGRRNRLILTVSDYSRRQIAAAGVAPLERIQVVHNGADHMLRIVPDAEAPARLGLARGGYVLSFATTQAHKNVALLMRAFADPRLAGVPLVLVGGAGREAFEAAGIAVPAGVVFAGPVKDGALRALMEGALCLAFPSTTEGFGLPPLEAMILGCPAVVAPCGALPEVCGEAAIYAAPDDPGAWVEAILALAGDSAARDARIEAGRRHAAGFTWRGAAARLIAILHPFFTFAAPQGSESQNLNKPRT